MASSSNRRTSYFTVLNRSYHPREETPLEAAVEETWKEAQPLVAKLQHKDGLTFHPTLTDAFFCGHTMPDVDSIAGAVRIVCG
jgi:hypothetical protein